MAVKGTRLIEAHPLADDQWADDLELLQTINVTSPKKVIGLATLNEGIPSR